MQSGNALWKSLIGVHVFLYRATAGRIGGAAGGLPLLLLTTRGRRTGKARTVPLGYVRDGDALAVIGSYGGRDRHPEWYLNIQADPNVRVRLRGRRFAAKARTAAPEEWERCWREFVRVWPRYEVYAGRTKRRIPIVVVGPEDPG